MASYVAFLRGIMPMNPNMRNAKLRNVFEELGFKNVRTVISSGNVLFESGSKNIPALETKIEKALLAKLGFKSDTMIRSKEELEKLVKKNPFKKAEHGRTTYLLVTFMKKKPCEVFSVLDLSDAKTPLFMRDLEKKYGKEITSRTWKTVGRIADKLTDK